MFKVISTRSELESLDGGIVFSGDFDYQECFKLSSLPDELVQYTLKFCDLSDIARFARVSRKCRYLTNGVFSSEAISSLFSYLPKDFFGRLGVFEGFQTSRFFTKHFKDGVPERYLKVQLLTILERYNLKLDNIDVLTKDALINDSVDLALVEQNVDIKSSFLSDLVTLVLELGDGDKALEIMASISDVHKRLCCFKDFALWHSWIGDIDKSTDIVASISDLSLQSEWLLDIAKVVLERGDVENALEIFYRAIDRGALIWDIREQSCHLWDISKLFLERGYVEKAKDIAETISLDREKSFCLCDIVVVLIQLGDVEKAKEIVMLIPYDGIKSDLLSEISKLEAETGNVASDGGSSSESLLFRLFY